MRAFCALFFLSIASSLLGVRIDPDAKGFDNHKKRQYVEVYDFTGHYPNLEHISIDAVRKKCVEIDLSGEYPSLESLSFDGTFGTVEGVLTGSFPLLREVEFQVTRNKVKLDLRGKWESDCLIAINGTEADLTLLLPDDVGLIVHTKRALQGRVRASDALKKKGFGLFKKRFVANLDAPVTLTLDLAVTAGTITLE